ncbi:MAG: ZIP family metal transporter [Candidatus Diapherotrites archaeon]|uniref:ZIP family metal transporter n=1 Tax=Candidatus Iainarchaeum sp. TaxID=3101447 RepID=A0A8T4C6Z6_9ARCH|nr:ZIP family metal transporter [Candidatus Diapherotrites archaeon]
MDVNLMYALLSVIGASLISLIGLVTLSLNQKRLKSFLVYVVAFAAGALFGDALIHLLPEAVEELGFGVDVSLAVLAGIIVMFLVEKIIHWRHCHYTETEEDEEELHLHHHASPHAHAHAHHKHSFAWVNLVGDAVHNFIDGIVIGAAYVISIPTGIATTLAVIFHEIPQEIGDFGVLLHGGFSTREALTLNLVTALTAVLGTVLVFALGEMITGFSVWLVPFAAGSFLYIAGSDLIPELHKKVAWKKSAGQLLAFGLGILVMMALLGLE